jgi:hypothetical protein
MKGYMPDKQKTQEFEFLISHGCDLVRISTDTTTGISVPKISMYCTKFDCMAFK